MAVSKQVICEPRSFKLAFGKDGAVNIREIKDDVFVKTKEG
ncbi:MAG: hypothetical protein ABIW76_23390 [Fibrobacteria bacterium]